MQMEPLLTKVPYMVAIGNHERDWPNSGDGFPASAHVDDSEGECGVAFERRFLMPTEKQDEPWCAPWLCNGTSSVLVATQAGRAGQRAAQACVLSGWLACVRPSDACKSW